ncbi:uncharacterized protein DUF3558 [Umezawaea tangerina]|uniref:Uncharacterized protein DUF3558 n=1 Tax=Umezawaea tangerina TaxID=84725 RepID=A0A2T0SSG7_9PSEU|nr:uncharacterized protein DUF3558 [Umezawaea tangerina]
MLLAALALAGCSYSINGTALPDPSGPPATSRSTSAAPSSPAPSTAGGPAPKIAKPRTVAGVDPCKMLDANDLKFIGPFKREPRRQDDTIPESCQYLLEDGTTGGRTVVTALYQRYEQVRDRQKNGKEQVVEGHSTWWFCQLSGPEEVCTATIAVNANRSILVAMSQAGGVPDQMVVAMAPLLKAALARIPVA